MLTPAKQALSGSLLRKGIFVEKHSESVKVWARIKSDNVEFTKTDSDCYNCGCIVKTRSWVQWVSRKWCSSIVCFYRLTLPSMRVLRWSIWDKKYWTVSICIFLLLSRGGQFSSCTTESIIARDIWHSQRTNDGNVYNYFWYTLGSIVYYYYFF